MTDTDAQPLHDAFARKRQPRPWGGKGEMVTDIELIERLGVPVNLGYAALHALDENPRSGFPRKQKLWGDRRLWSSVLAYLEATCGGTMDVPDRRKVHERA